MERVQPPSWVLLVYKIPREPTAGRAYVWRKMKRLGALLLHDSVWVLPSTPWTREQFQWLAVEIIELGGEAFLWESDLLLNGQAETLVQQFVSKVETAYQEILAEMEQEQADLVALSRKYQQVQTQDYFQSALGKHVRDRLLSIRGGFES
ncbi:MAG TPA: Chromate resistance protein ChrB [Ktedonobacteraceae bacterium]|nr:Chromate resistance protein ChrB [Ktedonobacteraceae bacterium]